MGKYAPLNEFLRKQGRDHVPMTFAEIEEVLGVRLPASRKYPAWWSNNPSNNPMTREWLNAGYRTADVDIAGEKVSFRKTAPGPGLGEGAQARYAHGAADEEEEYVVPSEYFARLGKPVPSIFGAMKGTTAILSGVDLTEPADPDWGRVYDDDYDHGVVAPKSK